MDEKKLVEILRDIAKQRLIARDCWEITDDWIEEEMNNIIVENNNGKK